MTNLERFNIIGIDIKTSNEAGQSGQDIPALWQKFLSQNMIEKIPNKLSSEIFCIYTEYEGDHTQPYTTLLGCKVASLETIPEGMRGMTFVPEKLHKSTAKGNLNEGAVWKKWVEIWNADLDRAYTFDFEVYGEKAQHPENAEVDIYVSVR